jgi:hypothetical protein
MKHIEFHFMNWFVNAHNWYWKPVMLNKIGYRQGYPKIYRWLFLGWIIEK